MTSDFNLRYTVADGLVCSEIIKTFQARILAMPPQVDVPDFYGENELLSTVSPFDVEGLDLPLDLTDDTSLSPSKIALAEDEFQESLDMIGENKIRLARKFMIEEDNDFRWLLRRVETAAGLMITGSTEARLRNELVELVGGNEDVTLDLGWDPMKFMSEQYSLYNAVKCRLQEVICLCGAGDVVEAQSCGDYVDKMWPKLGQRLLDLTSSAMESGHITFEGCISFSWLDDGFLLMFIGVLHDDLPIQIEINCARSSTSVRLRGDTSTIVESGTFFIWLSTAVRAAPEEKMAYCTPEIQLVDAANCKVTYHLSRLSHSASQTCWQEMFRNPVVAHGYPIAPRQDEEQGLGIPFSMMAILAQTPFVTSFQGATILKGFSTILSLTQRAGAAFTWHFLIDRQRQRMTYSEGLSVTELRQEVGEHELQMGRHFVGWTPCVEMLAGK